MNFKLRIKNWLAWLQNLPDNKKKIILWTVVGVLAVIMGFFWVRGTINNLSKIGDSVSQIKFPEINTPEIPNILETTTPTNK